MCKYNHTHHLSDHILSTSFLFISSDTNKIRKLDKGVMKNWVVSLDKSTLIWNCFHSLFALFLKKPHWETWDCLSLCPYQREGEPATKYIMKTSIIPSWLYFIIKMKSSQGNHKQRSHRIRFPKQISGA